MQKSKHKSGIIHNIQNIRNQKEKRFEYAKELAWENESLKLKGLWDKFIFSLF